MHHREVSARRRRHRDHRNAFGRRRQSGKERERQMPDALTKFVVLASVPRVNGIKALKGFHASPRNHTHQVKTRIDDGPRPIRKPHQRQNIPRTPNFGVLRARRFQSRQGKYEVPDRPRTNQEPPHCSQLANQIHLQRDIHRLRRQALPIITGLVTQLPVDRCRPRLRARRDLELGGDFKCP